MEINNEENNFCEGDIRTYFTKAQMSKEEKTMKYIDLDFVEPSKKKDCIGDFANCVHEEDGEPYICLACEYKQVKEKYPNAKYTDNCEWVLYEEDKP